jgi:hypothetical protein
MTMSRNWRSRCGKAFARHAETRDELFELWGANTDDPTPQAAMEKLFEPFFCGVAAQAGKVWGWVSTSLDRSGRCTAAS